uniref:Sushi domain-containing protein n=1 Tax=Junco hyemalis TaxID=40217 RepID=A0A8C5NT77_JUNHY
MPGAPGTAHPARSTPSPAPHHAPGFRQSLPGAELSSAELGWPGRAGGGSAELGAAPREWLRCPGSAGGPAMGSGRCCSLLLVLVVLVVLLELPAAWGDCGPLPNISHAEPRGDAKHQQSFSVGSTVTFACVPGYTKLPFLSNIIQCLSNSRWSSLPEFCGRSCPTPRSVQFATLSPEDKMQNFYAVNTTVRYICHLAYENTTAQLPTSTCLDNLTWTEVPELCQKKSCGIPANPEHGQVILKDILKDHLLGGTARVVCDHGYRLKGASPSIRCLLEGNKAVWSPLPACQVISCPPPPAIPHGQHSGNSSGEFVLGSVTTYTCEPGLELVGQDTLRCTGDSGDSGDSGTWSGAPPACRVRTTAETNQTKPSEENPYWLASILIPSCIVPPVALGILAGIIVRRKENEKHSYNVNSQKQEVKGRDAAMHLEVMDEKKLPKPWNSYFCHTGKCHVCPSCEEQLHSALAPLSEPPHHGCAACQDWLSSQPQKPRSYSVPSVGDGDSQSPAGTSSPAMDVDMFRADGTGGAAPWRSEAEQPMDHQSDHICPTCESWLRAHTGQGDSRAVTPGERQHKGPQGPVCPPCTDRQLLSLIHGDTASSPVCPLAGQGTPAHLVPPHSPGCHLCPVCSLPSHAHLCQPQRLAPDG